MSKIEERFNGRGRRLFPWEREIVDAFNRKYRDAFAGSPGSEAPTAQAPKVARARGSNQSVGAIGTFPPLSGEVWLRARKIARTKQLAAAERAKIVEARQPAYPPDDGPLSEEARLQVKAQIGQGLPKGQVLTRRTLFEDRGSE